MAEDSQKAFVLRVAPSGIDRVSEAVSTDQIFIGWSEASALLNPSLNWEQFRNIISAAYYSHEETMHRAGGAAGNMWRFIREMTPRDIVVVPHGAYFHVAEVAGIATFDLESIATDTAYRRPVHWLNSKLPIPRSLARSALISRMKIQGTCSYATDLLDDIRDVLAAASAGKTPTFHSDLLSRLTHETLHELRKGRMESFSFERLIRSLLINFGAKDARIVPRSQDKGADILATFLVAGAFRQVVAVQAKHWQPEPPVGRDVVEQLIRGIEAESADLGMVITSGTISNEATSVAQVYFEEKGIKIELVDGEQFAKLIVEHGIRTD